MQRRVVLGVDSSTQSTKVLALDLDGMAIVGEGRAPHSGGTTQHPSEWWEALVIATNAAVTAEVEVAAISVGGQQHGLVTLDAAGGIVRPAPLWNNVDAAEDAATLNDRANFAEEVGTRLVASVTIAKLGHLARTDPSGLSATSAVCLPHDWLTFMLSGEFVTDRGDASGSGWWSPRQGETRQDLLALAIGDAAATRMRLPTVLGPEQPAGTLLPGAASALGIPQGIAVGPGTGDNMAAALGIGATVAELVISLGTSGTAFAVSEHATADPTGGVCGFADATGRFLPLACMINCTRVVDIVARLLGLGTRDALDRVGKVDPGAGGLLMLPYLGGERTPNLPAATGSISGFIDANAHPDLLLRAAVDGVAAGLAYCQAALIDLGVEKDRVTLVGGGASHPTWRQAIADATGLPVTVRSGGEHAARGAALQAAAIVLGEPVSVVAEQWRPGISAEIAPRPGFLSAFRLEERRDLIGRLAAQASSPRG